MKSKIFKKIALCFASVVIVCSVGAASGCNPETDHPEVRITYEFNGKPYDVEYKLYRNMYPHTVRRFIELSDEGFYNDMIIHNYQTNDWFTGGYDYNAGEYTAKIDTDAQTEYFEFYSKADAYFQLFAAGKLSVSVYSNRMYDENGKEYVDSANAMPTVMGEFYNNIKQEIKKGALTADYGCLKMFYYEKDPGEATNKVYVTPTSDQIILADYGKNCATSLFAVQTGYSSTYSQTDYTVFAQLKGTDVFDELLKAVKEYVADNHSGTDNSFYSVVKELHVDGSEADVTFQVPKQPIIVRSVKVTKY